MAKKYIKKYHDGNKTESPASGAEIKKDTPKSPLPVIDSTKVMQHANAQVYKDTGIKLPGVDTTGITPGIKLPGLVTTGMTPKPDSRRDSGLGSQTSTEKSGNVSSLVGNVSSLVGNATSLITSQIKSDPNKNATGFNTQQQIGDMLLKSGNPYAMAAGAAYKALSGIAEATGGNVNTITKDQSKELGISGIERIGNNVLGTIHPGLGWAIDETTKGQKSIFIDEMSNAYADTVSDINRSNVLGDSNFLFGRQKIENSILTANKQNKLLTEINLTNTQRKKTDYAQDLAQQNVNRYTGTNYMDMRMGRKGMKIQSLEEIRELLKNRVVEELDIQKFAEGGSLMPAGKLHKELSHINELGEQYEDLTRKGIPVVTLDEGGEIQQVAEVERDEWIWNLEFTQQIEALWKDGSEEAMIEAGKLLTEELLWNTDDISGIIHKEEEKDGDN